MKTPGVLISVLASILIINSLYSNAFSHNFYKNQGSILFTLVKQFEVEDNLASNNLNTNESISLKHAENAANLLKLIVAFNNSITSNANFVNTYNALFDGLNLTTKAIVAASLADECLKEYGLAQGLDPNIAASLLNMIMNTGNPIYMGNNISTTNESTGNVMKPSNNHVINQINFETLLCLRNR